MEYYITTSTGLLPPQFLVPHISCTVCCCSDRRAVSRASSDAVCWTSCPTALSRELRVSSWPGPEADTPIHTLCNDVTRQKQGQATTLHLLFISSCFGCDSNPWHTLQSESRQSVPLCSSVGTFTHSYQMLLLSYVASGKAFVTKQHTSSASKAR